MEISNILIVLLFVLPGMLSDKIAKELGYPSAVCHSDFLNTINGIMLSFPILLINGVLFALKYKITSINNFITIFDNTYRLFYFILSVIATSILIGFCREKLDLKWETFINKKRKKRGKMPSSGENNWSKFLLGKNKFRFLEVIINGQSYKGFAGEYSTLNENISIILEINKNIYTYDDFDINELFTDVIGTYIDIEKNVVIKDYDISKYEKWCKEKTMENAVISSLEEE